MTTATPNGVLSVAFDSACFARPYSYGAARYFSFLVDELNKIPSVNAKIISPFYRTPCLKDVSPEVVSGLYVPKLPRTGLLVGETSDLLSKFALSFHKHDVIHETGYLKSAPSPKARARVVTVLDMIPEIFPSPGSERHTRLKKAAVMRADQVVCISKTTQEDLIRIFGIDRAKTSVAYLGGVRRHSWSTRAGDGLKSSRGRPYILYVGVRGEHKNFLGFLRAFGGSSRLKRDFDIVCFGANPFVESELKFARSSGVSPSQLHQSGGADDELFNLYENARALVYPSLYEGFGIPLLEAMEFGCPVIASDGGSIPEVVGQAAKLFDGRDEEAMRAAMEEVLYDDAKRSALVESGRERCKVFSWERCALETLSAYLRVV